MNSIQGGLLGAVAAGVCFGLFLLGRNSAPLSTPNAPYVAPKAAVTTPASALPPVIMYPKSSGQPMTGLPAVPALAVPSANASAQAVQDAKNAQLVREKDRLAEIVQSTENANRMNASAGNPPLPNYQPTFHVDTSGNVYHLENGNWRLLSNNELENPSPQEQAEAEKGLAAAKADQGQRP